MTNVDFETYDDKVPIGTRTRMSVDDGTGNTAESTDDTADPAPIVPYTRVPR